MDNLANILGLAISALGLGNDIAQRIKEKTAKKVVVTPNLVETTSRHWDSTNSVIVQNTTNKPVFSVQVVFWHNKNQQLQFKFEPPNKEAQIKDIIINYGIVVFDGTVSDEKVVILEILRLLPSESIEIDLQIEKQGTVRIFPAGYDEKRSKQVLNSDNNFGYPFNPPFSMSPASIRLFLRKIN